MVVDHKNFAPRAYFRRTCIATLIRSSEEHFEIPDFLKRTKHGKETTKMSLTDRDTLLESNPDIVKHLKGGCDIGSPNGNKCWLMRPTSRNRKQNKYPHMTIRGPRAQHYAYRIGWVLQFGSIDPDKQIRHQCNNERCINPSHLILGTAKGNGLDRKIFRFFVKALGDKWPKYKRPNFVIPPISLWPGWELPEHQAAYERHRREVEAGAAADVAAEDAAE